jgi:hypothetical protein
VILPARYWAVSLSGYAGRRLGGMAEFTAPPCPVHDDPKAKIEHLITVPDGHMCFIGPPNTFIAYIGNAPVPYKLARPGLPFGHETQLIIAIAPLMHEWEGEDIEPLRAGAFICVAGIVIDMSDVLHVCLYDPRLDTHTCIANYLIPSLNLPVHAERR